MKIYNFSAGPSILPKEVFDEAGKGVKNYNNSGLSILEYSHRSETIVDMMDRTSNMVLDLMELDSNEYAALFLHGGASSQFNMIPFNLLGQNRSAAIINTGKWSINAIKEAKLFGKIDEIASSEDKGFNYIPKTKKIIGDYAYVHYTTNNTIFGTEFHHIPVTDSLLIADMSSDIFSREWDYSKYDLIYAGAQKNLGPAGTTLVVIKKNILGNVERKIPTMLDYKIHIEKKSSFNTPPVFPIYVCMLTLKWIKKIGGIKVIEKRNKEKAEMLYSEIDNNDLFTGYSTAEDRSFMNVTFTINDKSKEQSFIDHCSAKGVLNIKGHRSVGGFRASIYNAMNIEGVGALVDCMKSF